MDESVEVPGADIDWALQDRICQLASAAAALGADDPAYTGSVVDVENARLRVYRKPSVPSQVDDEDYRALAQPGVSIEFEAAPLSARETANLDRLIVALVPQFKAAGITISSWGTDFASGVRVDYYPTTSELPQYLRDQLEIYGPGTVSFRPGRTVSLADFSLAKLAAEHPDP
jgi:hypothetical protein